MEIKGVKNIVKFEPIKVNIEFTITSYDELREFIEFYEDNGEVTNVSGNTNNTLTELIASIVDTVAEGL